MKKSNRMTDVHKDKPLAFVVSIQKPWNKQRNVSWKFQGKYHQCHKKGYKVNDCRYDSEENEAEANTACSWAVSSRINVAGERIPSSWTPVCLQTSSDCVFRSVEETETSDQHCYGEGRRINCHVAQRKIVGPMADEFSADDVRYVPDVTAILLSV